MWKGVDTPLRGIVCASSLEKCGRLALCEDREETVVSRGQGRQKDTKMLGNGQSSIYDLQFLCNRTS